MIFLHPLLASHQVGAQILAPAFGGAFIVMGFLAVQVTQIIVLCQFLAEGAKQRRYVPPPVLHDPDRQFPAMDELRKSSLADGLSFFIDDRNEKIERERDVLQIARKFVREVLIKDMNVDADAAGGCGRRDGVDVHEMAVPFRAESGSGVLGQ